MCYIILKTNNVNTIKFNSCANYFYISSCRPFIQHAYVFRALSLRDNTKGSLEIRCFYSIDKLICSGTQTSNLGFPIIRRNFAQT